MKKILTILSLILALSLCVGAIAETAAAEQPTTQTVATDKKALTEALEAYKTLKGSTRVKNLDALKQELESFVAEGKLTQEQADLILKYYTERMAARGQKPSTDGQNKQKQNARDKQQRHQPTNDGEQNQMQRQQRQQNGQQSQQNGSSGDVDTTSSATTKRGK